MNLLSKNHPVWGMAFRPFYPLAALYGTLSILLWSFGYPGTAALVEDLAPGRGLGVRRRGA